MVAVLISAAAVTSAGMATTFALPTTKAVNGRAGGPPPVPTRQHLWIESRQPACGRNACSTTRAKEKFTGQASQGDDEDWPPDAPIDIADTTAVAKTHGDVATRTSRGEEIDIHELLKREAFASPNEACDNHFEKNRPCPDAVHGFSDQYVSLDSWVKDLSASVPSRGIYSWNFMVQGVSRDQNVGVRDKIDTVVEMQIGSFIVPNFFPANQMQNPYGTKSFTGFPRLVPGTDLFSDSAVSATFGFFPYVGRMTIEMKEIGLQSISQRSGTRYHFEADVIPIFPTQGTINFELGGDASGNPIPTALRVVPLPGFDTYVFTDPIKDVHGLTVVFRSIDKVLPFPPDVLIGGTAYTDASIYPNLGLSFILGDTDQDAMLRYLITALGAQSTQIMISGLSTGNAAIDNWVNQAPGLVASIPFGFAPGTALNSVENIVQPLPASVQFTLSPQVDISPLVPTPPAPNSPAVVIPSATPIIARFATARIRIPLRLRRVVQRLTNYQ